MGKNLDKFILLMWKNFLLQWRHPVQTLVEVLAPVLFACMLVVLRSLSEPEQRPTRYYNEFPTRMVIGSKPYEDLLVPYSPCGNAQLDDIMNTVVASISSSNRYHNITAPCVPDLELYVKGGTPNEVYAGIQFDTGLANKSELSPDMNIDIRFPAELRETKNNFSSGNWLTNRLFSVYQVAGPRYANENEGDGPGYNSEGFLFLQQHLSLAIIKAFNPDFNSEGIELRLQRFAYPKWTQDVLVQALQAFVGIIFMLSFVYTCISTVKVITTEKEKQLKEAMKIMGLPGWLHWTAWFIKTFTFLLISIVLMIILLKTPWYPDTDFTVFTYSNPIVIFLFLILFMCATITFCFAISVFFTKANTAATVAGMAWFLSYFPYSLMMESYEDLGLGEKIAACLCSNSAMAYGFQLMIMFEGNEEGLQWNNLWKTTTPDDNLVFGHILIMLVVDTIIYLLVALYVEAVFPGEYGVPLPWNFPFTASYWLGEKHSNDGIDVSKTESEFFEKEPKDLYAGIQIKSLRKEFANKKVAVKGLSVNMYQDQITVLLGHNGAGKTTTMSMLTGMFTPSSGTAVVNGHDIRTNMDGVRDSLGLCPQHNILFDELTVKEHLYFYSRLKGLTKSKVDAEIEKYVNLLELQPKANAQSSTLSGGMKRKLSVGVALCGGSSVVMCDEPTAGMDPSARRALWDLLQEQKKGRTILLSTHFMDEADLLGDRIAIMAEGELQCCGSSFFLKKKYGAGYHLVMDKSSKCNVNQVTALLQKHIPNIEVESSIGSELTYVLNEDQSVVFEKMLGDLEKNSPALGVNSYGISLTTLEEVFMKVGASHTSEPSTNGDSKALLTGRDYRRTYSWTYENGVPEAKVDVGQTFLTGWALVRNQVTAMFMKRTLSILRSWILFLIQNAIPVLFLVLTIIILKNRPEFQDLPKLKIELDSYDDPITVMTTNSDQNPYYKAYLEYLQNNNKNLLDWENANMDEKMIQETKEKTSTVRSRYIVGARFVGENKIVAMFNNNPFHSPPLALQAVINSILHVATNKSHSIQISNHPLPFSAETRLKRASQGGGFGFQVAFNLGFSMAFASAFYVMFYIRERVSKAKHLQFVSGIEIIPFWGTAYVTDLVTFIFNALLVIIVFAIFQEDGFSTAGELGRVFSVFLYFGFSMIPMMYLASYLFDIPSTGYTRMALINIITGVAAFLVIQILSQPALDLVDVGEGLHWLFLLVPHYSFSTGIRDLNVIYSTHTVCNEYIDACVASNSSLNTIICKAILCQAQEQCCTMTEDYYDMEAPGIGRNFLFSFLVGGLFIAILLGIEYRFLEKILYKFMKNRTPPPAPDGEEDGDVAQEKKTIRNASSAEIHRYKLVMKDITKYYNDFLAVNSLCLGVKKYECFGLLGVNGAGKTTTFKMMTGDIKFSYGEAWVNGLSLKTDMKKVHQIIGYCPQFDALLDDLTARETLLIFGLLRGISMEDSKLEAEKLSRDFDFHQHLDKKVKELSGGNKRKLSTAIALIGDPQVIYLDEPTTGMDPATKRYLWNALCKIRDNGKSIVLTSHSMEECEALCTRLAIMVNGVFRCLGSTQHLKSKFSEGYTLTVKVRKNENSEKLDSGTETEAIERFIKENFRGAVVREKHQELITFYITDKSLAWSKMFGIMERGKQSLHIEDYSLGQSSLEQVFLTFTKHQRDD